jgi:hypothetical protein
MDNCAGDALVPGYSTECSNCGKPRLALVELTSNERRALIALAAYFRAEKRGFAPGSELQDWLEAEREIFT